MTVRVEELNSSNGQHYRELLRSVSHSLLYHSLNYRNFLRQVLVGAEDKYLLAYENDQLSAAIPVFIKSGPFGSVANSLPFYGSNGSIVASDTCRKETKRQLLRAFDDMCREKKVVISTIVDNPLDAGGDLFEDYKVDFMDERIGQLNLLPDNIGPQQVGEALMASFHGKTRNLVRKGEKTGFTVTHDGGDRTLHQLHKLHEENMKEIGGLAKSWTVFQAIRNNFTYDEDYRVYTASIDGQLAAGLLVFYFNKTVEYFTPVVHRQYRSRQPLSYLIYLAMKDAVTKGCKWWNWGGTWLTQDSVYHFKSRWGAVDSRYRYFIKAHADISAIKRASKTEILESYPFFYVLPFSELGANGNRC